MKGYHANPGVGLNWPADWQAMTTTQLAAPNLAGNNASEIVVGPFAWIPQNVGHECMLMIVSATGDPSNIVNLSAGESILEWRLVPNDNNIAQRNVAPIAGGGGLANLLASLHKRIFYVRNPFKEKAKVTFEIILPKPLLRRKVTLVIAEARENTIIFGENEKIPVTILMDAGIKEDFKIEEFENNFFINVVVKANGITIGGMIYEINPKIKQPTGFGSKKNKNLNTSFATTVENSVENIALNEEFSKLTVKKVTIKKINVDIEFEE